MTPAGQSATGAVGTGLSFVGKANVTPSGQVGTSAVGSITPAAAAKVRPDGVSATVALNDNLIIWHEFDTTQTPNYSNIDDTQTPGWTDIDESETASWEDVA